MNKPVVFNSGVPTEPDVKRLIDRFGVPKVGSLISYRDIATTIHTQDRDGRFRSVVDAWRKALYRNHNIRMKAVDNVGYEVMDAKSCVLADGAGAKSGLRAIVKSAERAARTDTSKLTPEMQRSNDHVIRLGSTIQLVAATEAKRLKYPDQSVSAIKGWK